MEASLSSEPANGPPRSLKLKEPSICEGPECHWRTFPTSQLPVFLLANKGTAEILSGQQMDPGCLSGTTVFFNTLERMEKSPWNWDRTVVTLLLQWQDEFHFNGCFCNILIYKKKTGLRLCDDLLNCQMFWWSVTISAEKITSFSAAHINNSLHIYFDRSSATLVLTII